MVSRFCVRPTFLRWALMQNPVDRETIVPTCHVGLHVNVTSIQTSLVLWALEPEV